MARAQDLARTRASRLLRDLPDALAERVLDKATLVRLERGQVLFTLGAPADAFYVILEGWVKLFRLTPDGAEAVVAALSSGESFAEPPAFLGEPYPVSAMAATDARVMKVPMSGLREEMRCDPDLALAALASSHRFLRQLVTQIERLEVQTAPQRLAAFLLGLTETRQGACEVRLPHEKQLLAGRLGMSPESLSRALARLRTQGVRGCKGGAVIHDVAALRRYVNRSRKGR